MTNTAYGSSDCLLYTDRLAFTAFPADTIENAFVYVRHNRIARQKEWDAYLNRAVVNEN